MFRNHLWWRFKDYVSWYYGRGHIFINTKKTGTSKIYRWPGRGIRIQNFCPSGTKNTRMSHSYYCNGKLWCEFMKNRYRKWNNTNTNTNNNNNTPPQTVITLTHFPPFLVLRCLTPLSTITNLHIFLSFSYSFLLVAGWWLSLSYRYGRPDHDQQHCYHHTPTVKPEAATAVVVAPDDGREDARNMLSCT